MAGMAGRGATSFFGRTCTPTIWWSFYYQPLLKSTRGEHGMGKNMYGKAGKDAVYKVPAGTVIYRIPPQILEPPPAEEDSR